MWFVPVQFLRNFQLFVSKYIYITYSTRFSLHEFVRFFFFIILHGDFSSNKGHSFSSLQSFVHDFLFVFTFYRNYWKRCCEGLLSKIIRNVFCVLSTIWIIPIWIFCILGDFPSLTIWVYLMFTVFLSEERV